MKKRSKMIKIFSAGLALAGILFLLIALLMWQLGTDVFGISFPRNDSAHIGFIIVGILYIIIAFGLYLVPGDKKAMIEENDERNQKILSLAGLYAFTAQSFLLCSGLLILSFMGYMNVTSAFFLCFVIALSAVIFTLIQTYLQKKF